ncbi:heme exporter protein CcmB [Rickettsiella endosymbiont of Miltochrista miniata]|uniref:heme exporter protein CcmB n=1 Tax=Rickettsiella endosymbiont of Miltochrista miniata TaxID=3066239 RepID=UPI00313A7C93
MLDNNSFLKLAINLRCELLAVFRYYQELIYPLLFLILAVILFPLSISADPILLEKISPGIFWVIVLFLVLLMLDQLFRNDWKEGDLEQLILLPNALALVLFVKLIVFCLVISVSLFLVTPILSLSLFIPVMALKTLYLSILLGTPSLIFLGGIARALTLGLRHSGLLIVLIIIPFYIPVLIFASSAVTLASMGLPDNGPLAWLGVIMILSMSLSPLVISKILRLGIAFA